MANTIGTLNIDVLANIASMVSDLGKAQQEANKFAAGIQSTLENAADSIKETFGDLAGALGLAFSVDKIVEFGKAVTDQAEKVSSLAQSLGVSTQSVQTLGFAAALSGSSIDTVSGALEKLERSSVQANSGNVQTAEAFRAIGVSVTDASGALKPADQLFQEVAQHISQFADGPTKVAVAMQLMGRGAAEQIPFLNSFGQSAGEMADEAERLGVVLSGQAQAALVQFKEQLNLLGQTEQGIANQMMSALAPALTEVTARLQIWLASGNATAWGQSVGAAITTVINWLDQMKVGFTATFAIADQVWETWKTGAGIALAYVQFAWDGFVADLKNGVIDASAGLTKLSQGALFGPLADAIDKAAASAKSAGPSYEKLQSDIAAARAGLQSYIEASNSAVGQAAAEVSSNQAVSASLVQVNAILAKYHDELGQKGADKAKIEMDALKALDTVENASNATGNAGILLRQALQKATDDVTGSYDRATAATLIYNAKAKDTQAALDAARLSNQKFLDSLDGVGDSYGQLGKDTDQYVAHIDDVIQRYDTLLKDGASVAEANAFLAKALNAADDAYARQNDTLQESVDVTDKLNTKFQEQLASIKGLGTQQLVEKQYLQDLAVAQAAVTKAYGDGAVVSDTMKQKLHDLAAQQVQETEAAKQQATELKDWASIASSAFDSAFKDINKDIIEGGSVMKDLVNVAKQVVEQIVLEFEKLAIINPLFLQAIFGSAAGNLPTLGTAQGALGLLGSSGGSLGNIGSLFSSGGLSNAWNGVQGSYGSSFLGGPSYYMDANGFMQGTPYAPSGIGNILGIGGGLLAGYSEFNSAGGGLNGLLGGATYGLGTLAATGALGGLLSGAGISAGISGSLGSIGLGAMPVIGEVALGAMALNMLTGGGLFGTSWKPTGNTEEDFSIGSSGADVSASAEESKKGAFFSGRSWRTVPVAVSQQTTDAMNQFFAALQTSVANGAKALSEAVPPMVTGSFKETFDKNGKITSELSTVLGQTYSETIQDFETRITADNLLALLPASQNAQKIAASWQSSASTLLDGSQMLLQAQLDINNGMGLFGTADTSLSDIASTVESLAQSGETLSAAYARLQTEQADFASSLTELGLSVGKTGADFVTFADQVTTAAGGINNLNAELASLYAAYIPATKQAANSLNAAQTLATKALSAIGENTSESMAQFWTDFQAALPTLSATQTQQWIAAGLALANYTAAVNQSAATLAANQQKYADFQVSMYNDQFVSAVASAIEWEQTQIATANQLAQAAGKAGASQQDLANIMTQSALQMGKAISDLVSGIDTDITTLFGAGPTTNASSIDGWVGTGLGKNQVAAQQAQAQQMSQAYDLIQKLGDYAYATGGNAQGVLSAFGISASQIGKILGETDAQVTQQITAMQKSAGAEVSLVTLTQETNAILRDLLDVAQGKAPSVSLSQYSTDSSLPGSVFTYSGSGKIPPTTGIPGGHSDVASSNIALTAAVKSNTVATLAHNETLRNTRRYIPTPRNTRGRTQFA